MSRGQEAQRDRPVRAVPAPAPDVQAGTQTGAGGGLVCGVRVGAPPPAPHPGAQEFSVQIRSRAWPLGGGA